MLLEREGTAASPRSMKSEQVRAERRAMLTLPHIEPLAKFAAEIRI